VAGPSSNRPRDLERVSQIITRAEDHFRKGKLFLEDNKKDEARNEFDRAVDTILESGIDVKSNQRLQTYYLELIERIYREEVAIGTPETSDQSGSTSKQFDPSPLDELSKLVLTSDELNNVGDKTSEGELNSSPGFTINPLIQQFINYYQARGRNEMEIGFKYSTRYLQIARTIFTEEGVPVDLTWLAQVLSRWNARALSHTEASGHWQLSRQFAQRWGLRRNEWVDERMDFAKSTRAAAKQIKNMGAQYNGNWELAIVAFIIGPENVDRAIARAGSANYWIIYPYIPQDARNYVPAVLATILIAKNPAKYGINTPKTFLPKHDTVAIPASTSLNRIASLSHLDAKYLSSINPQLLRGVTPPNEVSYINVPAGKANEITAILDRTLTGPEKFGTIEKSGETPDPRGLNLKEGDLSKSGRLRCELSVDQAPSLRTFRLGLTVNQALSKLNGVTFRGSKDVLANNVSFTDMQDDLGGLTITLKVVKKTNETTPAITFEDALSDARYTAVLSSDTFPQFEGTTYINLWFLDNHLSTVSVEYDSDIKWKDVKEFSTKVANELSLYGTWESSKEDLEKQTLDCDGFVITAKIAQPLSDKVKVPMLIFKETDKWDTFVTRKVEKIQRAEQQKKDSFRP